MITRMKLKRILREMTQTDLWRETGIPQWRLSVIERGIPPRGEEAEKIATALGSTPEEIFSFDCQKSCSVEAVL